MRGLTGQRTRSPSYALRQVDAAPEPVALVITDLVLPGGGSPKLASLSLPTPRAPISG
jgi:hypothetical protein